MTSQCGKKIVSCSGMDFFKIFKLIVSHIFIFLGFELTSQCGKEPMVCTGLYEKKEKYMLINLQTFPGFELTGNRSRTVSSSFIVYEQFLNYNPQARLGACYRSSRVFNPGN